MAEKSTAELHAEGTERQLRLNRELNKTLDDLDDLFNSEAENG